MKESPYTPTLSSSHAISRPYAKWKWLGQTSTIYLVYTQSEIRVSIISTMFGDVFIFMLNFHKADIIIFFWINKFNKHINFYSFNLFEEFHFHWMFFFVSFFPPHRVHLHPPPSRPRHPTDLDWTELNVKIFNNIFLYIHTLYCFQYDYYFFYH